MNSTQDNGLSRLSFGSKCFYLLSTASVLTFTWYLITIIFNLPSFILPTPWGVLIRIVERPEVLLEHAYVTLQEIFFGLILGLICGMFFAIIMLIFSPIKRWILPILIISQAVPVFALAPIFMLWLGYGIASKIVMAAIIIFFPLTMCSFDGLSNTPRGFIDLAKTMGSTRWQRLRYIQIPAALPAIASGLRVACVVAPIGAITGEWVGSSAGLGYLMLQANARMQVDDMFAALFVLSIISLTLYFMVDALLRRYLSWAS